ncbi:MAG: acyl--CoA ligase [Oscillospiraceae bacterium]|jgi:long-chain acyl-CoA synthetase|nr:acyl--CoA ligase [Oscillospiraceae bacterium]
MGFPSEDCSHLAQYDQEKIATAFDRADDNADTVLFRLHQGEDRKRYATNFMGLRTTYEQLDAEIDRVARALKGFGIAQGEYVSIALPNIKESILYIYGCWRIGAAANLIDPRTNGKGIAERVRRTRSKLLVTVLDICDPKIDEVLDELPTVIVVGPCDSVVQYRKLKPTMGALLYKAKKKRFREARAGAWAAGSYIWHTDFIRQYTFEGELRKEYSRDMPAAILYTSGTASDGVIKGAVHTHYSFNAAPGAFQYSVRPEEYKKGFTFGGFIPFFSAYGALCGMHSCLCAGLEILLVPIFDPNKFDRLVLREKPSIFLGVPRFFEQLADSPKLRKKSRRLSFIKIPVSGGDKISPASLEKINEALVRNGYEGGLRIGYGSTEFGGSISVMRYYHPHSAAFNWRAEGNVGVLLPGTRAMVVDPETMRELPYGEDGELLVHSQSMMLGYYGAPEATEEITYIAPDGVKYYRMGDKGHLDEQGCFHFVDRYKRSMMRPDGHTVHPSPIENAIMSHAAVDNCAVVGLRAEESAAGVIPSAFVVLRGSYETEEAKRNVLREIDALCLQLLPERDRAIAYKAVEELPYTLMGKIHFRELEKEPFDENSFVITDFAFFPKK